MIDAKKLSNEEKKAIEEFRLRMEDILEPYQLAKTSLFYNFLKARDFDIDKAEKMLRKNMNWRKAYQVDTIFENFKPKEFFRKYIEFQPFGLDKDGDIVIYLAAGRVDSKDVMKCSTLNDYMRHMMWNMEHHQAYLRQVATNLGLPANIIVQAILIFDLDKLTFGNATNKFSIEICLRLMKILQDNYPESLKTVYVINAPAYYIFGFSILKQLMSSAMIQKIQIFGQDGWKEELLENVDADVLPAFLGGNRTDPDGNPLCKTFICHPSKIPSCYYLRDEDRYFKDMTQVRNIIIPQMRKEEIYITVREGGSLIQWEFFIKDKDIGFGLFLEEPENNRGEEERIIEVLPIQRYDTPDGKEIGSYKTHSIGKYIITFDNSYSWLNSKKIEYCIKVVKPEIKDGRLTYEKNRSGKVDITEIFEWWCINFCEKKDWLRCFGRKQSGNLNAMIDVEKLNNEEKKAIEELRLRMEKILQPDELAHTSTFYRFLKARDFDIDKAEKMLRKHINWRRAYQVDTIFENFKPKEFFLKYIKFHPFGLDKDGDMVMYFPAGSADGRDVMKCSTMNEYMKDWIWNNEQHASYVKQVKAKLALPQNIIIQANIIVDLDKLTFGNATNKSSTEICLRIVSCLQDNYPETMKSIYIINAPGYYVFLFSLLKALLSSAMIKKIHIFGHNGWKEKLIENIDATILPAFLGGNRTDPDGNPLCKTFICHAGKISPCYYLRNEDRYFKDTTQVKKIIIPQMGKEEIYITVNEEGSLIQWEFFIKDKDIGFGLLFEESERITEVLPFQRYDTLDGTEIGSYKTQSVGKYIITFDNSYSWLNSKQIEYCIKVVKPEFPSPNT